MSGGEWKVQNWQVRFAAVQPKRRKSDKWTHAELVEEVKRLREEIQRLREKDIQRLDDWCEVVNSKLRRTPRFGWRR